MYATCNYDNRAFICAHPCIEAGPPPSSYATVPAAISQRQTAAPKQKQKRNYDGTNTANSRTDCFKEGGAGARTDPADPVTDPETDPL